MATPIDSNAPAAQGEQFLTFQLGSETFAIGILCIKEIIAYAEVVPVPMVPDFVHGIINLRGSVVPVIDLAVRLGRTSAAISKRTCIVIIEMDGPHGPQTVGVVVDSVNTVLEIPTSAIEPTPAFGANLRTDYVYGMGKVDENFVIILNVAQALCIAEMASLLAARVDEAA